MSDVWDDIGSRERAEKKQSIYSHLENKPKPVIRFPDFKAIKLRNLEALTKTFPNLDPNASDSTVYTLKLGSRKFDFWPATDCWYSHATGQFGNGIIALLRNNGA